MAPIGQRMSVYGAAASQYANRPKDENYADLGSMIHAAQTDREHSKQATYNLKDLSAVADDRAVYVKSPVGKAGFTHWAFSQFCRLVGAPASYLRSLRPDIAASALTYNLSQTPTGSNAVLLVRAPNGEPTPMVRSVTSDTYGRLWDAELHSAADRTVFSSLSSSSGAHWQQPPVWGGGTAGTWRGDRDSFVIRVDGGSIVTDPSIRGGDGRMYRGILIRNSEVGASAVDIQWVLFEYICGNLNLWGAVIDRRFRRRHVGVRVLRDTIAELHTLARQWTQRSASQDETIIRTLIDREIAHTDQGVIDELRAIGYTLEEAKAAVATCERDFNASPRSYWGVAQGTTKNSQQSDYCDERYTLDQLAAKLLTRGAKVLAS